MIFSILAVVVLILGGTTCGYGQNNPPKVLYSLVVATFTGALSSYLFFHFYVWKDTFGRNMLYAGAVLLLFGFGILCGKTITKSLCKNNW